MSTQMLDQLSFAAPSNAAINVSTRTVCLMLSFGAIGTERKVKEEQIKEKAAIQETEDDAPVEIDADLELVRVAKKLIVSKELDAIKQERRKLKKQIMTVAVPSFLKEGIYRVPYKSAEKVLRWLKAFVPEDQARVDAFMQVYEQRCQETEQRLKGLGEKADYPPATKVKGAFYVRWQWTTFETSEKFKTEVSDEFFAEAQARANASLTHATNAITMLMRQELQKLVDHLADVLKPNGDGTAKRFQKSTVNNLKEWLATFRDRNVTDDDQLELIVKSAEQLLDGVDTDTIKTNEAVKDQVARGMDLVKQCLDGMVLEAGSRAIAFEG